jgi:thioredoxin-related protein
MKIACFFFVMLSVFFTASADAQTAAVPVAQTAATSPAAQTVIDAACKKAGTENKKVLLIFHASWCGWCHKMDTALNDLSCKLFFEKNYVIEHLTVQESPGKKNLENPGAEALLGKFNGKNQGIPYWVILDKDGKLLFDSQMRSAGKEGTGSNIGCPAREDEVEAFIKILKQTSPLTDAELKIIAERFAKNKS